MSFAQTREIVYKDIVRKACIHKYKVYKNQAIEIFNFKFKEKLSINPDRSCTRIYLYINV